MSTQVNCQTKSVEVECKLNAILTKTSQLLSTSLSVQIPFAKVQRWRMKDKGPQRDYTEIIYFIWCFTAPWKNVEQQTRIEMSSKCFVLRPFNYFIPIPRLNKQSSSAKWRIWFLFKSICGGRCLDQTRRILVWKSTSAGRWTARRGLSRRSIRSTSSRVGQWSWSSWLGARER